MLARAIIPKCQRPRLPAKAALHFGVPSGFVKRVEKLLALLRLHIDNMVGESTVYINQPLFGFGMRPHHRMHHWRIFIVQLFGLFTQTTRKDTRNIMRRREIFNLLFYLVRQALVGHHHIGEQRVTADFRQFQRAQNRPERRGFAPCHIRVPHILRAA